MPGNEAEEHEKSIRESLEPEGDDDAEVVVRQPEWFPGDVKELEELVQPPVRPHVGKHAFRDEDRAEGDRHDQEEGDELFSPHPAPHEIGERDRKPDVDECDGHRDGERDPDGPEVSRVREKPGVIAQGETPARFREAQEQPVGKGIQEEKQDEKKSGNKEREDPALRGAPHEPSPPSGNRRILSGGMQTSTRSPSLTATAERRSIRALSSPSTDGEGNEALTWLA